MTSLRDCGETLQRDHTIYSQRGKKRQGKNWGVGEEGADTMQNNNHENPDGIWRKEIHFSKMYTTLGETKHLAVTNPANRVYVQDILLQACLSLSLLSPHSLLPPSFLSSLPLQTSLIIPSNSESNYFKESLTIKLLCSTTHLLQCFTMSFITASIFLELSLWFYYLSLSRASLTIANVKN